VVKELVEGKDTSYVWTKIADSAYWKKSYNFQMMSLRDTLWVLHGDGNWYSPDGERWTKSTLPNALHNLAFLDYVIFNNGLYALGQFDGNIERFQLMPTIRYSKDLKHWITLATDSNLPHRFFYHPFVFDHKIWIIGGEDGRQQYDDIWNSSDGVHWTRVGTGPFGKRSSDYVVYCKGRLYLIGNDVWSSSDGLHWQLETAEIVQGESIFGYAAVVYDDKIWLLGCNRNGIFSSEVLVSDDGKSWEAHRAPWSPRGGIAAAVFNHKVYITGGKYGGTTNHPDFQYSNDLWMMAKLDVVRNE
jgi:hypothetical protein